MVHRLLDFMRDLTKVSKYNQFPVPKLAERAVKYVCWAFVIFGAIASQPVGEEKGAESMNPDAGSVNAVVINAWRYFMVPHSLPTITYHA